MYKPIYLLTLVIFIGALPLQQASPQSNNTPGAQVSGSNAATGNVEIKSCVKVFIEKGITAYSVAYDYEFPGRASVHVNGLGTVPGKGNYRYLRAHPESSDS